MPIYYIVPAEDQSAESFTVPLYSGRLEVRLPLENNTIEHVLRPLAKWLNFPGCHTAKKLQLIDGINKNLSLRPMSEAVARWPALSYSPPGSLDAARRLLSRQRALCDEVARKTPEFLPHAQKVAEDVRAALTTMEMEELREKRRQEAEAAREPDWMESAVEEAPSGPHYKITVVAEEDGHDGYCSGVEEGELEVVQTEKRVYYLPDGDWDFEEKTTWEAHHHGHCCCGAVWRYTVENTEKVNT